MMILKKNDILNDLEYLLKLCGIKMDAAIDNIVKMLNESLSNGKIDEFTKEVDDELLRRAREHNKCDTPTTVTDEIQPKIESEYDKQPTTETDSIVVKKIGDAQHVEEYDELLKKECEKIDKYDKIEKLWITTENEGLLDALDSSYHMYIECVINERSCNCMIDTGAMESLIGYELAEKIGICNLIDDRKECRHAIVGVGGKQENVGMIPFIDVIVGDVSCPVSFDVVNDPIEHGTIILGVYFLRRYGAVIDFSKNVLTINGINIPIKLGVL